MLNWIGDEAAEELLAFYESHLKQGVTGPGKYEAHFSIALLLWRNQGNERLDDIIEQFRQAAATAVGIIEARPRRSDRTSDDLFDFMFPLYVTYIFGTRADRLRLAALNKDQWAPHDEGEYSSVIMLFELLCKGAVKREFDTDQLHRIIEENEKYTTHPFYQPWVEATCRALLAIPAGDLTTLEEQISHLIELHTHEALNESWIRLVEGLMAFWPLALVITAKCHGLQPKTESEYLPELPTEAYR